MVCYSSWQLLVASDILEHKPHKPYILSPYFIFILWSIFFLDGSLSVILMAVACIDCVRFLEHFPFQSKFLSCLVISSLALPFWTFFHLPESHVHWLGTFPVSSKFYPSFLENLHCISAVSLSIISTSILPVLVASHVFGHYQFPFAFLSRVLVVVSSRSCVAFPLSAFPFPTISRRRESRCRWPGAVGDMRRCWSSGDLVMFRCGCRWCGLWVMSALGCGCWQQRQPARRQSRLTDSCSVAVRRQRDRQPLLVSLTLSCYFVLSLVICVTVDVIMGVVVFIVFHLSSRLNWKHYVLGLSIRLCVPSGGILRLACRRLLMKSNWLLLFSLFFYYCWLGGRKGIRPVKN